MVRVLLRARARARHSAPACVKLARPSSTPPPLPLAQAQCRHFVGRDDVSLKCAVAVCGGQRRFRLRHRYYYFDAEHRDIFNDAVDRLLYRGRGLHNRKWGIHTDVVF